MQNSSRKGIQANNVVHLKSVINMTPGGINTGLKIERCESYR